MAFPNPTPTGVFNVNLSGSNGGAINNPNAATGNNRLLIVDFYMYNQPSTVFGVTYGGTSLTFLQSHFWDGGVGLLYFERRYLLNPAISSTADIVLTADQTLNCCGMTARFYNNVRQQAPGKLVEGSGESSFAQLFMATGDGATGSMLVDGMVSHNVGAGYTPGSGQTADFSTFDIDAGGSGFIQFNASTKLITSPWSDDVDMDWTLPAGAHLNMMMCHLLPVDESSPQIATGLNSQAFTGSPTTHNVSMPASVEPGDGLVVGWCNITTGTDGPTTPSGWTREIQQVNSGSIYSALYVKTADGSEDGTNVNFVTSPGRNALAIRFRVPAKYWANITTHLVSLGSQSAGGTSATVPSSSLGTLNSSSTTNNMTVWGVLGAFAHNPGLVPDTGGNEDYFAGHQYVHDSNQMALELNLRQRSWNVEEPPPFYVDTGGVFWNFIQFGLRLKIPVDAAMTGTGVIAATGRRRVFADDLLQGISNLVPAAKIRARASTNLPVSATIQGIPSGVVKHFAVASLLTSGAIAATGSQRHKATWSRSATVILNPNAHVPVLGAASLTGTATVAPITVIVTPQFGIAVEMQNELGAWIDITADIVSDSLECFRGRESVDVTSWRSNAGTLRGQLLNDTGKYSYFVDTGSPKIGVPGRKIRVKMTNPDANLWVGFLDSIYPRSREGIVNYAELSASGPLSRLRNLRPRTGTEAAGGKIGNLIRDILVDAGMPLEEIVTDEGITVTSYWFAEGSQLLDIIRDLEDTDLGFLWENKNGQIVFHDRHRRFKAPYTQVQKSWQDVNEETLQPHGNALHYTSIGEAELWNQIINECTVIVQPYAQLGEVAWQYGSPWDVTLVPGQSIIFTAFLQADVPLEPREQVVDAWITPVPGTDLVTEPPFPATSNLAVNVIEATSTFFRFQVTNTHSYLTAWFELIRARGGSVSKLDALAMRNQDFPETLASEQKYGYKPFTMPAKWVPTVGAAQAMSNFVAVTQSEPWPILTMTFPSKVDSEHGSEVRLRDLGERHHIYADQEMTALGVDGDFSIEAIHMKFSLGETPNVVTTWTLAPVERNGPAPFFLDIDELDTGKGLGF